MPVELMGLVGILLLLVLLGTGLPVAFCFLLVGALGLVYLGGIGVAVTTMATIPYSWTANYGLVPILLFALMSTVVINTGIARELFQAANAWIGWIRGGLAMATILACGIFSCLCGSSVATATAIGRISIPEMQRYNYDGRLAAGVTAAGGTLGILIPPSITFIIYGMLVEESIGKLFIAGILPGLLLMVTFMIATAIVVRIVPNWAPVAQGLSMKDRLSSLPGVIPMALIIIGILGGIYGGIFTPTEAGAIGATFALIIGLIRKRLTRASITDSSVEAGQLSCAIFFILIGAMVFNRFLVLSQLPQFLSQLVVGVVSPVSLVVVMCVIYLVLGCFMDATAMLTLTIPIFLPLITALHIDLIWFGVIVVVMMEVGMITPPVGMNLFAISSFAKGISSTEVVVGVLPFLGSFFVTLVILIAYPQISLYLPSLMR